MKHRILTALGLALALSAAAAGAAPADVAGDWQGQYFYPSDSKERPVSFTARLEVTGTTINGYMVEPKTFGDGSGSELRARLTGVVSGGRLNFNKQYDGSGGVSHSVAYSGVLDANSARASGNWVTDGGYSGRFEMWQTQRAVQVGCLTAGSGYIDGPFFKVPFTNRCDRMVRAIQCAIRGDGARNLHALDVPARGDATMVLGNVPPITNAPWVEDQGNPCN